VHLKKKTASWSVLSRTNYQILLAIPYTYPCLTFTQKVAAATRPATIAQRQTIPHIINSQISHVQVDAASRMMHGAA
jgi:hypothetical protein